ncbi:MAG TPA: ankyrin repeat domain-containing protein [Terracidiphilus sp.]|jgi:ankyrin repeat protein|nr:ankyrin repeat domain-containing protein [Terracidiphilus sp.]
MKYRPLFLFAIALIILSITGCKPNPAALMTAVKADNTEEAKKLIEKGADPNSRTSPTGWSALHYAARNGNVEVVSQLLKAGADPNYSGAMEGQTGNVISLYPLVLAQATLDLVKQIPAESMEETLHQIGLDDPALLKSMKAPDAAVRYQKVVDALTPVTTKK